jgi:hypothetical protein
MTQDEIIEMAKEAGCFEQYQVFYFTSLELEAFAKLVAAKEREACAKVAEHRFGVIGSTIALAIRARTGEQT